MGAVDLVEGRFSRAEVSSVLTDQSSRPASRQPLRSPAFLELSLYIMTERASAKTITVDIGRYR
jgi:hypothetical protein